MRQNGTTIRSDETNACAKRDLLAIKRDPICIKFLTKKTCIKGGEGGVDGLFV